MRDRDEDLTLLKVHWANAQSRINAHYDLEQHDVTFSIGDIVYLKI